MYDSRQAHPRNPSSESGRRALGCIGMKRSIAFLAMLCLIAGSFAACEETTTTPPADKPVTLDISTKTLVLSATDSISASTMTLSCGCSFLLDSIHYTGDTSIIQFTSRDTLSRARATQVVTASFSPSATPIDTRREAALDFIVFHTYRGVSYVYYDTIRAVLN
jgi:hypothetical protein